MAHGHTGTVIACDDLSDFDFSTFELIASLLTNAVVRHLVVVFTTGPRSARSFVGPPDASHEDVELLPLSADGTLIWLRSTMQWEAPRAFVDWLHEASGGARQAAPRCAPSSRARRSSSAWGRRAGPGEIGLEERQLLLVAGHGDYHVFVSDFRGGSRLLRRAGPVRQAFTVGIASADEVREV